MADYNPNIKIHVSHLKKDFGKLEVLKDISIDITEGEVVVIIGPSGSGKSTFLRCMNQLEEVTSGEIVVDGNLITDPKVDINKVRERVGMVFQHFNLFNNMNVLRNLMLAPVDLKKADKAQAEKNAMEMLQWALAAAIGSMISYDTPTNKLRKEIPITSYDRTETMDQIRKWIMDMPQSKWPGVILTFFHGEGQANKIGYADGARYKMPAYKPNKLLDMCYEWLTQFGYQMSDEEIRMMGGTHECFQEAIKA